jgi:hypothetical protein
MTGTENQVEWAEAIKRRVSLEFDRVAAAFRSVAGGQSAESRANTEAILGILERKRAEVMSREQAGYFIHDWQEIGDQVRQLISHDASFQAIRNRRAARRPQAAPSISKGE